MKYVQTAGGGRSVTRVSGLSGTVEFARLLRTRCAVARATLKNGTGRRRLRRIRRSQGSAVPCDTNEEAPDGRRYGSRSGRYRFSSEDKLEKSRALRAPRTGLRGITV